MDTNKEKIQRFASGKFSFNDYLSVSSNFNENVNEGFKTLLEDDWNKTSNSASNANLQRLLNRLHKQITGKQSNKNLIGRLYTLASKIAVVLIIPALITIAVLSYLSVHDTDNQSWAEIHAPVGSRTKFHLPDGSEGWLNSGSSLKYPVNFKNNRNVEISGEAWFDVVHDDSQEFTVTTPYFDVKVLGTQFNVVAYDNEETAEVVLERGKVLVVGTALKFKSELLPDQELKFDRSSNQVTKAAIDSKLYTSWKDGLLIFKNVPMVEMAKKLERKYNVDIVLHSDSLKSSVFRATFQDESMGEIMSMLSTVAPIRYKIHNREKKADSTFTKGKVEIWLKNN